MRDTLRAALALCKAGDAQLAVIAAHDPGMIRDVAASCLWAWSARDKEKRQAFITMRLPGGLCRRDLMDAFGISMPQASLDIQAYRKAHPDKIRYDARAKRFSSPLLALLESATS